MNDPLLAIADDLTGANALAALLQRQHFSPFVVQALDDQGYHLFRNRYDALIVNMNTRNDSAAETERKLARIDQWLCNSSTQATVSAVRIDSTLRGHIGMSAAWAIRKNASETERPTLAICVPAYPDAKRVTQAGIQYINGVPVDRTELANDHQAPVHSAEVAELFRDQNLRVQSLSQQEARFCATQLTEQNPHSIADTDILIIDAATESDIHAAAHLAARLTAAGFTIISIDPGTFTAAYAAQRNVSTQHELSASPKISATLALVGSISELTAQQLDYLQQYCEVTVVDVDPHSLLEDPRQIFVSIVEAWQQDHATSQLVITTHPRRTGNILLASTEAKKLRHAMADLGKQLLDTYSFAGIFCSGGDIADALLSALSAPGIEITGEIQPLAVAGVIRGGEYNNLRIVTKGGLVGDSKTLYRCLDNLAKDRVITAHSTGSSRPAVRAEVSAEED